MACQLRQGRGRLISSQQKEAYSMAQLNYEIDAVVLRYESAPVFPA
jgi:hypothetical protein